MELLNYRWIRYDTLYQCYATYFQDAVDNDQGIQYFSKVTYPTYNEIPVFSQTLIDSIS